MCSLTFHQETVIWTDSSRSDWSSLHFGVAHISKRRKIFEEHIGRSDISWAIEYWVFTYSRITSFVSAEKKIFLNEERRLQSQYCTLN
jgi:hypothetical protein